MFDQVDLVTVQQTAKYLYGEIASWADDYRQPMAAVTVPEPATVVLALVGLLSVVARRWTRRGDVTNGRA